MRATGLAAVSCARCTRRARPAVWAARPYSSRPYSGQPGSGQPGSGQPGSGQPGSGQNGPASRRHKPQPDDQDTEQPADRPADPFADLIDEFRQPDSPHATQYYRDVAASPVDQYGRPDSQQSSFGDPTFGDPGDTDYQQYQQYQQYEHREHQEHRHRDRRRRKIQRTGLEPLYYNTPPPLHLRTPLRNRRYHGSRYQRHRDWRFQKRMPDVHKPHRPNLSPNLPRAQRFHGRWRRWQRFVTNPIVPPYVLAARNRYRPASAIKPPLTPRIQPPPPYRVLAPWERAPPPPYAYLSREAREALEARNPVHVLGNDPRATYIAHHLGSRPRGNPVSLILPTSIARVQWHHEGSGVTLERHGRLERCTNISVEVLNISRDRMQRVREDPALDPRVHTRIYYLVVTLPPRKAARMLARLAHRIGPWTTVCLIHTGLGLPELLNRTVFRGPNRAPYYVLGHMTHDLGYNPRRYFTVVELRPGTLRLAAYMPLGTFFEHGYRQEQREKPEQTQRDGETDDQFQRRLWKHEAMQVPGGVDKAKTDSLYRRGRYSVKMVETDTDRERDNKVPHGQLAASKRVAVRRKPLGRRASLWRVSSASSTSTLKTSTLKTSTLTSSTSNSTSTPTPTPTSSSSSTDEQGVIRLHQEQRDDTDADSTPPFSPWFRFIRLMVTTPHLGAARYSVYNVYQRKLPEMMYVGAFETVSTVMQLPLSHRTWQLPGTKTLVHQLLDEMVAVIAWLPEMRKSALMRADVASGALKKRALRQFYDRLPRIEPPPVPPREAEAQLYATVLRNQTRRARDEARAQRAAERAAADAVRAQQIAEDARRTDEWARREDERAAREGRVHPLAPSSAPSGAPSAGDAPPKRETDASASASTSATPTTTVTTATYHQNPLMGYKGYDGGYQDRTMPSRDPPAVYLQQRTPKLTKQQQAAMRFDTRMDVAAHCVTEALVSAGLRTDADFVGGWFVRRGAQVGIKCPHTETMLQLLEAKRRANWRQQGMFVPFIGNVYLSSGDAPEGRQFSARPRSNAARTEAQALARTPHQWTSARGQFASGNALTTFGRGQYVGPSRRGTRIAAPHVDSKHDYSAFDPVDYHARDKSDKIRIDHEPHPRWTDVPAEHVDRWMRSNYERLNAEPGTRVRPAQRDGFSFTPYDDDACRHEPDENDDASPRAVDTPPYYRRGPTFAHAHDRRPRRDAATRAAAVDAAVDGGIDDLFDAPDQGSAFRMDQARAEADLAMWDVDADADDAGDLHDPRYATSPLARAGGRDGDVDDVLDERELAFVQNSVLRAAPASSANAPAANAPASSANAPASSANAPAANAPASGNFLEDPNEPAEPDYDDDADKKA